jgi:hypothetical protein
MYDRRTNEIVGALVLSLSIGTAICDLLDYNLVPAFLLDGTHICLLVIFFSFAFILIFVKEQRILE